MQWDQPRLSELGLTDLEDTFGEIYIGVIQFKTSPTRRPVTATAQTTWRKLWREGPGVNGVAGLLP